MLALGVALSVGPRF